MTLAKTSRPLSRTDTGPTASCLCGNPRYSTQDHCIICARYSKGDIVLSLAAIKGGGKRKLLFFSGRRAAKIVELAYSQFDWEKVEEGESPQESVENHATTHTVEIRDEYVRRVIDGGWIPQGWEVQDYFQPAGTN